MSYTKPQSLNNVPGGDTVKSAIVDKLDVNATQIVADLNTHEARSEIHGATGAIVGTTNTQTLTNKTLTTPTIANFTNATHDHSTTAEGGTLTGLDSSFLVSGRALWLYENTAPTGWTIVAACVDSLLAVKGGSVAFNGTGGSMVGTWTPTGHTHSVEAHTHGLGSHAHTGPSHTHTGPSHTHTGPSHIHTVTLSAPDALSQVDTPETGIKVYVPAITHAHGTTVSYSGTGETGSGGTGNTGAGGTGNTGAASGNTDASSTITSGSGAEAATYRPYASLGIIVEKD